jgi:hypothetical protein
MAVLRFFTTFDFASFFSSSFRTTAAFFGPLPLFFLRLGCGSSFGGWKGSAAFDADFEFGDDVGMEAEFDFVFAKDTNGVFEMNLAFVEADVELGFELIGDHAGSDSAEHFAVLASFDGDDANEFGKALGELGHGVELVSFALGAALLEDFQAAFICAGERDCEALRKKIVAGVTGRDADVVGLAAEADDVMC